MVSVLAEWPRPLATASPPMPEAESMPTSKKLVPSVKLRGGTSGAGGMNRGAAVGVVLAPGLGREVVVVVGGLVEVVDRGTSVGNGVCFLSSDDTLNVGRVSTR